MHPPAGLVHQPVPVDQAAENREIVRAVKALNGTEMFGQEIPHDIRIRAVRGGGCIGKNLKPRGLHIATAQCIPQRFLGFCDQRRMEGAGFHFEHPELAGALSALLGTE